MRQYELVAVLNSEEDQFKAGKQAVAELLAQYKAIDVKEDDMGDRPLAYPIKKKARAHYVLYRMSLEPASVVALERAIKLSPSILQHLVVKLKIGPRRAKGKEHIVSDINVVVRLDVLLATAN
jgi:small subunit ribosomal protein S6